MTPEEVEAVNRRENGRVGMEVGDAQGRRFWITDVLADDRLRVLGEDGRAYTWNTFVKVATPIKDDRKKRSA